MAWRRITRVQYYLPCRRPYNFHSPPLQSISIFPSRYLFSSTPPEPTETPNETNEEEDNKIYEDEEHFRTWMENEYKPTIIDRFFAFFRYLPDILMVGFVGVSLYGLYNFQIGYVEPMKALRKTNPVNPSKRNLAMKIMANKFQNDLQFITHKNCEINGMDIISQNKFYIVYCGYPDCNQQCNDILINIISSLKSNKLHKHLNDIQFIYIDLNVYDSAEKLVKYFEKYLNMKNDSNINILGLIPKNKKILREIIESFTVFIEKYDGEKDKLRLNHSNMIYFVDKHGLLYDVKAGNDEINEKNIIESVHNLLYQSESTFMGRLRNYLTLMFLRDEMVEMPNRFQTGIDTKTTQS